MLDRPFHLWTILVQYLKKFRNDLDSYVRSLELFVSISFYPPSTELKVQLEENESFLQLQLELGIIYQDQNSSFNYFAHKEVYQWLFQKEQI